jgi:hypothetical protein
MNVLNSIAISLYDCDSEKCLFERNFIVMKVGCCLNEFRIFSNAFSTKKINNNYNSYMLARAHVVTMVSILA